jgi:hypothetical protein
MTSALTKKDKDGNLYTRPLIAAFEMVAGLVPEHIPRILESPVQEAEVRQEVERARLALPILSDSDRARAAGHQRGIA